MKQLIINILCLTSILAKGQESTFGDTDIIKNIQSKCSIIYVTKDTTIFLLTKSRFYGNAISGTNLSVYSYKQQINRIVAFSTAQNGLLAVEYYYWDSHLIMIYETMEFYEEDSAQGQIRNFKNIPYWESRFYFCQNKLVAHKHSGRKEIGADYKAQSEIENARKIFEFVKKHRSLN